MITHFVKTAKIGCRYIAASQGKIFNTCADAIHDMKDGDWVAMGGFGI